VLKDAACEAWLGRTVPRIKLQRAARVGGPCARHFFENFFDSGHKKDGNKDNKELPVVDKTDMVDMKESSQKAADSTKSGQSGSIPDAPLGVTEVHSEEDLDAILVTGADVVVKLAFTWCRPCKLFWPKFQKFARVYSKTRFVRIVGNENASCKHYAQRVLKAKISPMFATYSGGQLLKTWTGANNQRFIENIEGTLATARECEPTREVEVRADETIAPK